MTRRRDPHSEVTIHRGPAPRWRGNRVFYVAVEGVSTEPDYLDYLNKEFGPDHQFVIHALFKRNGLSPRLVVARALEYRDERDGNASDEARRVQLWALFDRDQHEDIPAAMREARAGGVRVAFSHPSFELWLLLHFVPVSGQQSGSNKIIIEKLRRYTGFELFGSNSDKSLRGRRIDSLREKHTAAHEKGTEAHR